MSTRRRKTVGRVLPGGAYDVHPYMLLNYNGKYDDVSTLAHEFGHTMHSYLSKQRSRIHVAVFDIVAEWRRRSTKPFSWITC